MRIRITSTQLCVFSSIAKCGNVSRAAKKMFLSQSACSMALATFEEQLGGSVFDRHGKQLFLNEKGRVILPKANAIISQIKELKSMMAENTTDNLSGKLIIGAGKTIGNYLMPKVISEFIHLNPQVQTKLIISDVIDIVKDLLAFNIDLALVETNCYSDKVITYPWRKDELVIVASPKHPLSRKRKLTFSDIVNARWLLREKTSQTRGILEEAIGGKIESFLELNDIEAIKQATQIGLGISCLSRIMVAESLKDNKLIELKTPFLNLSRKLHILIHKEKHQSAVISEFLKKCN